MTKKQIEIRELTDRAFDAFWKIIVEHFPQAQYGELSPLATIHLHSAGEFAVEEWIDNNVPKAPARRKPSKKKYKAVVTDTTIRPGYRFILPHDVDRFTDFLATKGMTGTITDIQDNGLIVGTMDQHLEGAEQWDNAIWWDEGLLAFLEDTVSLTGEDC